MNTKLIYVHDPMCSWCWGFADTYEALVSQLPNEVEVIRFLGGLAPDTNESMPEAMQQMLEQTWQRIEEMIPGKHFNFDFWTNCTPRRATYPACRAVIAAREQGEQYDLLMTETIQQAYYQQAKNPSNNETLIELADGLGLDKNRFEQVLVAKETQQQLLDEIATARDMGINGFPSLILQHQGSLESVLVNYTNANAMLHQIESSMQL